MTNPTPQENGWDRNYKDYVEIVELFTVAEDGDPSSLVYDMDKQKPLKRIALLAGGKVLELQLGYYLKKHYVHPAEVSQITPMSAIPPDASLQLLHSVEQKAIQKTREEERERIKQRYGDFNDGCGCCMETTLLQALSEEKAEESKEKK